MYGFVEVYEQQRRRQAIYKLLLGIGVQAAAIAINFAMPTSIVPELLLKGSVVALVSAGMAVRVSWVLNDMEYLFPTKPGKTREVILNIVTLIVLMVLLALMVSDIV